MKSEQELEQELNLELAHCLRRLAHKLPENDSIQHILRLSAEGLEKAYKNLP